MTQRIFYFLFLLEMAFLGGCGRLGYFSRMTEGPQASPQEAIQNAENYLQNRPNWKIDCSHFVLACYHSPEMTAYLSQFSYLRHNLVHDLNTYLTEKKTRRARAVDIQPGDILVFNYTYDINHDGQINEKDVFTHTGIVENFQDMVVTYIDASESRKPPKIHRRRFSFYGNKYNETVATDPASKRKIHHRETFYAAYAAP